MEARLTAADLAEIFGPDDDPNGGERREPAQEPRQRVEPQPRADRWAWLSIAPDGALRTEPMAA